MKCKHESAYRDTPYKRNLHHSEVLYRCITCHTTVDVSEYSLTLGLKIKKKPCSLLSNKEVAKRVLKSRRNTVFSNTEQVLNTLDILTRMGILNTKEGRKK